MIDGYTERQTGRGGGWLERRGDGNREREKVTIKEENLKQDSARPQGTDGRGCRARRVGWWTMGLGGGEIRYQAGS